MSAAAFLAVSGVELTFPWPDEFTKQMAVQPPCFLHPTDVNASGDVGDNSLSSFYSRPNGTLLFHPLKRPDDVDIVGSGGGGGGQEKSPERPAPSEAMHPPPPVSTSFMSSSLSRAVADVPGSQLDAEYEAQLELYRRRQQGLANGVGPSIPGDCRPLSPIQDDTSYYPSPGSSPPSDAGEMDVEASSFSASTVGRASGVVPGKLAFPAAVASSPVSINSASVSDDPVPSISEARKHEAEAFAAVGAAQTRVKKEKKAAEKAKGEVRAASVKLAAAKDRVAEAEKEAEASINPAAVEITVGGLKSSWVVKKKRRKKNSRVQDFTAVTTVLSAGGGNGSMSGSDVSSESGMGGGRSGASSNGGATGACLRGEGGDILMASPEVGCPGGVVELGVSGAGIVGEVSTRGKGNGGIDAGMSDALCAQLKTKPMKGWGVGVEAELGHWEVSV